MGAPLDLKAVYESDDPLYLLFLTAYLTRLSDMYDEAGN